MAASIAIEGEIDSATAPDLQRRLLELIGEHPGDVVGADFAAVTFIDSSGLAALITAQREARSRGGDLWVTNLRPNLMKVFEVTGLDKLLLVPTS